MGKVLETSNIFEFTRYTMKKFLEYLIFPFDWGKNLISIKTCSQ